MTTEHLGRFVVGEIGSDVNGIISTVGEIDADDVVGGGGRRGGGRGNHGGMGLWEGVWPTRGAEGGG